MQKMLGGYWTLEIISNEISGPYKITPAIAAAQNGDLATLRVLLSYEAHGGLTGLDFTSPNDEGTTALTMASGLGHLSVVSELLKVKPKDGLGKLDLNQANQGGVTALFNAAQEGHPDVIEAIADYNASLGLKAVDPNCVDSQGLTPLLASIYFKNPDATKALLRFPNLNLDLKVQGYSAIQLAKFAKNSEIEDLLRQYLANRAKQESSLFDFAKTGDLDHLGELLASGVHPGHQRGAAKAIPLHFAASNGHALVVRALLEHRVLPGQADVNPNSISTDGRTPLYLAVQQCRPEVIREFAQFNGRSKTTKVDPNLAAQDGTTPILLAINCGKPEVVEELLAFGNVDLEKTWQGKTPLQIAQSLGNPKIIALLQR